MKFSLFNFETKPFSFERHYGAKGTNIRSKREESRNWSEAEFRKVSRSERVISVFGGISGAKEKRVSAP